LGAIRERIAKHKIICLDTPVFIYHLEAHPAYLPLTQDLLKGIQSGSWRAVTSIITILELTIPAWRLKREMIARQYESILMNIPNLRIVDITRRVARRAAQLRASYNLRSPDALQIAAGILNGASVFVTNDRSLKRIEPLIEIFLLDDYREIGDEN
jgi:predicted nucleic acid-binding protein